MDFGSKYDRYARYNFPVDVASKYLRKYGRNELTHRHKKTLIGSRTGMKC